MKSVTKVIACTAGAMVLAGSLAAEASGLAAALAWAPGAHAAPASAREIEGSWHFTVEVPPNPQNPEGVVFQGLGTYSRGGGFVQSDNNPATTPGSPGHGTWARLGDHTFSFTFEKLTFNPILQAPGIFKANETIEVDGDSYIGTSTAFFCNIDGENCIELGPAESFGRRINVE